LSLFTEVPRRGGFSEIRLYGVLGSSDILSSLLLWAQPLH
jgi:hypothetical protein